MFLKLVEMDIFYQFNDHCQLTQSVIDFFNNEDKKHYQKPLRNKIIFDIILIYLSVNDTNCSQFSWNDIEEDRWIGFIQILNSMKARGAGAAGSVLFIFLNPTKQFSIAATLYSKGAAAVLQIPAAAYDEEIKM